MTRSIFRYQRHKSMFIFFILLTIVSFSSIRFITPIPKITQLDFHCNDGLMDLKFCPKTFDHCAADLLVDSTSQNNSKELLFDVNITLALDHCIALIIKLKCFFYEFSVRM